MDVQVGMGAVQSGRAGKVYWDMSEEGDGAIALLPQGQCVILLGDLGQTAGLGDGT